MNKLRWIGMTVIAVCLFALPFHAFSQTFRWPVDQPKPTDNGYNKFDAIGNKKYHTGLDLTSATGSLVVRAVASGTARTIPIGTIDADNKNMGNVVIIGHNDGKGPFSLYAHLASITAPDGQTISQGDPIGVMGNTGIKDATDRDIHLHFELKFWNVLGNTDDLGPFLGYTPEKANLYGYMNPWPYFDYDLSPTDPTAVSSPRNQEILTGPDPTQYTHTVAAADAGQQFVAFTRYNDWYQVYLPSKKGPASGWIQGTINPSATVLDVYDPDRGTAGVSVRKAASAQDLLSYVWDGQMFVEVGQAPSGNECSNIWHEIHLASNAETASGWVCGDYLNETKPVPEDTTPPSISAFSVTPSTISLGQPVTVNYTVSDSGGSGLNRVILRRTSGDGTAFDSGWHDINTVSVSGNGPVSGNFSDTPSDARTYWYGLAVFDNTNKPPVDERQSNLGPLPVTVTASTSSNAAKTNSLTTQCNEQGRNEQYWIYAKFYSPYITTLVNILQQQQNENYEGAMFRDHLLDLAQGPFLIKDAIGIKSAKDAFKVFLGTVGSDNIVLDTFLHSVDEGISAATNPAELVRSFTVDTAKLLSHALTLFEVNGIVKQMTEWVNVQNALYSYYRTCGDAQAKAQINSLSPTESAKFQEIVRGVNAMYNSLNSNRNPGTVAQGNLFQAPEPISPTLAGSPTSITPKFEWSKVQGANKYWLMVAANEADLPKDTAAIGCRNCIISGSTTETWYTPPEPFSNIGRPNILKPNTRYYWQVMAFDDSSAASAGCYSTPKAFTTVDSGNDRTAPASPDDLTVAPADWSTNNLFVLDWTNPVDPSGISKVWWKIGGSPTSSTDGNSQALPAHKPLEIVAPKEGMTNVYVWLEDGSGNVDFRNTAHTTLKYDATPPAISITNKTSLSIQSSSVVLSGAVSDVGSGTKYMLWSDGRGKGGNFTPSGSSWTSPAIDLEPGQTVLTVWAIDAAGNFKTEEIPVNSTGTTGNNPTGLKVVGLGSQTYSGNSYPLTATATDPNGYPLSYVFTITKTAGELSGQNNGNGAITWTAPRVSSATTVNIDVTVSNGQGGAAATTVRTTVYPYDSNSATDISGPSIGFSSPADGASVVVNQAVAVEYSASDASGLAQCAVHFSANGANGPFNVLTFAKDCAGSYSWTPTVTTVNGVLRIYAVDMNLHSNVVDHRISVVNTPPPDSGTEPLAKPDVYQSREDTVSGAFTLVWSRVPGATSYKIQETFNGSTQYYFTAASSMPFTKAVNGTYYYKVRAVNEPRESDWGGPLGVVVNITPNKPPTVPTNPEPFMNRSGVPFQNLVLQWSSVDPDDPMGPRFQVALGLSPSSLTTVRNYDSDHARDTTLAYSGKLEPDTDYCWQVTAKDSKGDVVPGPIWRFRTAAALSFASPVFTDETATRLPAYLNQSLSVSVVDVNSDGLQDLAQVNGLPINGKPVVTVYRKDGSGRFVLQPLTGIPNDKTPFGGSWADIDGDGDPDVVIWYLDGNPRLFRNDGGFRFTDITASSGLVFSAIPTWTQNTCAWGDADGDGAMDLYCSWEQRLFHNNGDGTFTGLSQGSGISDNAQYPWATIWTDINEDGHPDLITVGPGHGTYINDGHGVFTLEDQPDYISVADRGIAAGDYDNDGHIDLYVVSDNVHILPDGTPMYPPDRLFKGNGDGTFNNVTASSGFPSNLSSHFAATWVDYDNDGWLDLVAGSRLFRNMGDSTFQDVTGAVGIALHDSVFGAVALDANGDGAQDLYFGTQNQDQLFMNQAPSHHWLNVELLGNASNKSGYGARLEARSGDRQWTRVVATSTGMGDQESAIQHIGVDSATKVDLQVRWPSGTVDELYDITVNQTLSVSEGAHVDATPPAAIANLTGVSGSATTIELSWTAPGDDGTLRTASRYELRWLNEPLTDENWAVANSVPDLPAPAVAGSRQSTRVSGLEPNKTYYFAFKTLDEAGNESAISNSPGVKTQLGQQILNFTATEFSTDRIDLHWKVPEVMIAKYEIRYSTSWLTEGNFSSGTLVDNPPEPGYPGDEQSARLTGLRADTTYYVAVRMIAPDGSGLPLSPVASAHTAPLSSRFLNTLGSGIFPYSNSVSSAPIAAGDVNGDGRTDLVATSYDGVTGKTFVRVNFGESGVPIGTSTCTVNLPGNPTSDQGFAVGDLDGDGKDDVVIGARNDSTSGDMAGVVYIYSGGSTLSSTPSKTITGMGAGQRFGRSLLTADLNHDGVNDLVVADINKIYIYYGRVGTFDTTPDMALDLPTEGNAFASPLWMEAGDINGDGLLDLAVVASGSNATLAIFSSEVGGGFSTAPTTLHLGTPYWIGLSFFVIADFTGDGIDDIAIGVGQGVPQTVRIYAGRAGQDWSQATPLLQLDGVLVGNMGLAAADINGDHVKDLLVGDSSAGGSAGIVRVFLGGSDLDAIPDKYVEVNNQNGSGYALLSVLDLNGDGYDDIFVVGSFSNYDPGVILAGEPLNPVTDDVPPAGVTDLAATSDGVGRVVLTWTAPGDDGDKGQASIYSVLQTVSNTFSTTWGENAKVLQDVPLPKAAGSAERLVITGLIPGQTYNFQLRAEDDVGNLSPPSNVASVTVRQGYRFTERFSFGDTNPPTCLWYGTSLQWAASAGDVNGDGIDDLLLFGGAGCGRVRVFLGSQFYDANPDFDVAGDATYGTDLNGVGGYVNMLDEGYALGDVNGDGRTDFYTSHQSFYNEAFYAGTASLSNTLPQGKIEEMETSGGWKSMEPVGDVNGDGMDDFVVMREFRTQIAGTSTYQTTVTVNLYLGNSTFPSTPSVVLSTNPNVTEVRGIGDFNGDGYADIALAVPMVSGSGNTEREVQIFFGGSSIYSTPGLILHATGLERETTGYDGGYARSIEGIGDFNGDGYPDLAVSAPNARTSTYEQGKVDIYFGGPNISGDPDVVLVGPEGGTFFGDYLLSAGDLNGDDCADFMVGGFSEATPGQRFEYFIYFGGKTPSTTAGLVFRTHDPALPDDFLSPFFYTDSVHNQGVDFNGDGKSELIWIGQRLSSNGTLHLVELVPLDTDGDAIPDNIDPYFDNAPPSKPTLSAPVDAATGVPLDVTLSWTSSDPDGDTLTYDLYFGVADTPPLLAQGLSNASYSLKEIASLAPNTRYYWKVVVSDDSGQTAESPVLSFVTGAPPIPGTPSGLTVSSSSTGNLLEWTVAGGGHVQCTIIERRLSGDSTWDVIAVADGGESHYIDNFELAAHQSYDYRLRNSNASGDGPYAATVAVVSFNNPPILSLPESVAFEAGAANTFTVAGSDEDGDAPSYRLVSGPAGLTIDADKLNWSPSASQIGRYTVNIEADDGHGGITNSQMQVMVVDATPPAITTFNMTPSEGTIGQSFSINYTVSDIGGTGLNRIELRRTTGGGASSDPNWITINTASLSGDGPVNGSFEDQPPAAGSYWYEVYVIDNAVPPNGATGDSAGVGPLTVTVSPPPVNGVCGTAAGMSFTSAPTGNLCASTDATPTIIGNGPWSWSCTGSYGGATASCMADLQLKGDLNHDYAVNLMDAILAFRALTGMEATGIRPDYATSGVDVNSDGKIDLAEVVFILQNIAGMR